MPYKPLLLLPLLAALAPLYGGKNYHEFDGLLSVEAEDYASQTRSSVRQWYTLTPGDTAPNVQDRDRNHAADASGEAYLEILPDTRATHSDILISGQNFMNTPGRMGVLSYNVHFNTPGTYIVWVRAFSTGAEDNGLHVGINGTWPESGQRIQLCQGKHQWTWSSAQRVPENHCGTPRTISITVPEPGIHTLHFSMREDGFEFDKFLLALDENYQPQGNDLPATFTQSGSYADLNRGSKGSFNPTYLKAFSDFETIEVDGFVPYYKDKARQALAINAAKPENRGKVAAAQHTFSGTKGVYAMTLYTMKETDGESQYTVSVNGEEVLKTQNTATDIDYSIHEKHAPKDVALAPGDIIQVTSDAPTNGRIPEGDITAYARGRWTELLLIPSQRDDH